jgi:hypothetical protein
LTLSIVFLLETLSSQNKLAFQESKQIVAPVTKTWSGFHFCKALPLWAIVAADLAGSNSLKSGIQQIDGQRSTSSVVKSSVVVTSPALYSLDKYGLEGLSFNGQSYLANGQRAGTYIVTGALFLDPAGNQKAYGWYSNSLDASAFRVTSDNSSSGSNPDYYQQVYRKRLADSVTFKQVWSSIDSQTLQIDTYITNNDSTDTLAQINWQYGLPLRIPGPANQYRNTIPIELGPQNHNGGYPAAFLSGTWGSLAIWMGDYSGTQNVHINYNSATQTATVPRCHCSTRVDPT